MTQEFFKTQMARMQTRFGARNIDNEFVKLVWQAVADMSEHAFARTCDVFIGSRTANKPPLLSDFREAYLLEAKRRFDNDVQGAGKLLYHPSVAKPLREVLMRDFGAVETAAEALEAARRKLRKEQP